MSTAILAVYFGSRDTASMDRLEAALAREFPGCLVARAFLNRRFPDVPSVPEALQQLGSFDQVLIQAMLAAPGPSYELLLSQCPGCAVGAPLLNSPDACIAAMDRWLPKPLLLMGHGASGSDLRDFAAQMPDGMYFAALEGQPDLDAILPKLAGQAVHLAPFLLTAGRHTSRDLTHWQARLEASGCTVILHNATLADCPGIPGIFAQHLRTTIR